jgi:hypothetical protein
MISFAPGGLVRVLNRLPTVESLGYFQSSLRDCRRKIWTGATARLFLPFVKPVKAIPW